MTEPKEKYTIFVPPIDDQKAALAEIVRQINDVLLRIAQDIASKADA